MGSTAPIASRRQSAWRLAGLVACTLFAVACGVRAALPPEPEAARAGTTAAAGRAAETSAAAVTGASGATSGATGLDAATPAADGHTHTPTPPVTEPRGTTPSATAAAAASTAPAPAPAASAPLAADSGAATTPPRVSSGSVDLTRLPIGDGKVASSPVAGSVYACQRTFNGGGAFRDGPWIRSDGTFDYTAKLAVSGSRRLESAFSAQLSGMTRTLSGNGVPAHALGQFPVSPSDPAYQYDRNPNTIRTTSLRYSVPARPEVAAQPSCLPMGAIGVMTTGVVIFNALDAMGRDAVAHEILDACGGHPERSGQYHYHDQAPCIDDPGTGHSALIGYALDGFGIFGRRGEDGLPLANVDLDACHGHTHAVPWDGGTAVMYHYHATYEYPYTLGCYRGTPVRR